MGKTILVIDDDSSMSSVLSMLLSAQGYKVVCANSSVDGLNIAKLENPDLILLDVMMSGLNGYQICRLLKADKAYKNIPIVMLSARAQDIDIRTGQEVGVNAYLSKPYDVEKLLQTVAKLLGVEQQATVKNELPSMQEYIISLPEKMAAIRKNWDNVRVRLEKNPADRSDDLVDQCKKLRAEFHVMSGIASSYGLPRLGEVAHKLDMELGVPLTAEQLREKGPLDVLVADLEKAAHP